MVVAGINMKAIVAALGLASAVVRAAPVEGQVGAEAHQSVNLSYFSGINIGTQDPWGNCKSTATWQADFNRIKQIYPNFNTIKLFTTATCDALMLAAPAAIAENIKIWAGVWAVDTANFEREKAALEMAIRTYGAGWLRGVNVGSESLYRKEIDPYVLANQVYDVKGMVHIALGAPEVPIGVADTWTAWEEGATEPVVDAVDVILMNGFPYWQGARIENALEKLTDALAVTRSKSKGKPIIVGETGWPTAGANFGESVPSVENLQSYWRQAACYLQGQQIPWFWFSAYDEPFKAEGVERNFGLATFDKNLKINLQC